MPENTGVLYVVATPIGNLGDISRRALEVLSAVDIIAAEDTRHSRKLLQHYNIGTPVLSCHEHNEKQVSGELLERLGRGEDIALVSDAGTPLISDPGFVLIRSALQAGVRVSPVPGPVAAIAALSVSGLPSDRFFFEGFLPQKGAARRKRLAELCGSAHTLVFYESPHRLCHTLADMSAMFGGDRQAVLARELTKLYESVISRSLSGLEQWCAEHPQQVRGEMVLLVAPAEEVAEDGDRERQRQVLALLLPEMSLKKAVNIASELTGGRRNALYEMAVALRDEV